MDLVTALAPLAPFAYSYRKRDRSQIAAKAEGGMR